MPFKKVELSKEEEDALKGGGNFFKFVGVGSKMLGRFVRTQPQTGTHAKKDLLDYVFKVPVVDEATNRPIAGQSQEVVVNTTRELNAKLGKCGLKPNWPVKITVTGEEVIAGYSNPVKHWDVEYDDSAPAGKATAPPPPPKPEPEDDLTF